MKNKEQVYFGGDIYTVDDNNPTVRAIAVKNGLIVAVGTKEHCLAKLGDSPQLIDLEGACLLPGFIDTHIHPTLMIFFQLNIDLSMIKSMPQLQLILSDKAKDVTNNNWIMGLNFDEQNFSDLLLPTKNDLDKASTTRPIIIVRKDGHSMIANTLAMTLANITDDTADPSGGIIERDDTGRATGVFRETAVSLLLKALPLPDPMSIMQAGMSVFKHIISQGVTSIGMILQTDGEGVAGFQGAYDVPLMQELAPHIPINLYSLLVCKDVQIINKIKKSSLQQQNTVTSHKVGGMKFWADGTFSSCTACMITPFTDVPDSKGFLIHTHDHMYERMVKAHKAGEQIAIHSIGDECARVCVDLFDKLLKEYPRNNHRHRLEHASLLNPELIRDIARLKILVSTQPLFIKAEKKWLLQRLGANRTQWTYAFKSLLDAGIKVAGASDAPAEDVNILQAIQYCVTRDGFEPQQCISAVQAIKMFTLDAAYAQFEEHEKGSLTVGKRADMVVLTSNPTTIDINEIADIKVLQTIVSGQNLL